MNSRNQVALGVIGLVLVGLLILFYGRYNTSVPAAPTLASEKIVVEQDILYTYFDPDQTIDRADLIFLGRVIDISPTRWNQDNGREWSDGLQIHTLDIEVLRPLVAGVDKGAVVTVTTLGESPLTGTAEHDLAIGDRAVFFARHKDLAWRGGDSRPIIQLVGDPIDAYYRQGSDGLFYHLRDAEPVSLKELTTQIARRRALLPEGEN